MGAGASSLRVEDVVRTAQSEVAYEYPLGEPRAVRHAIGRRDDDEEDAMMTWRARVAFARATRDACARSRRARGRRAMGVRRRGD